MNTSITRVQPHAVFRGGPNRVVDASKGGPTDSGWRNSVGITRARAAKAGSRKRVGSTKEGAYNSSFSRKSVGVTEERAAYSGSRDRLNVTRGRASDSGFRNFPSRPNEPDVAVAGAQRGKTRPSTAGGASSSRRQVRQLVNPAMVRKGVLKKNITLSQMHNPWACLLYTSPSPRD